MFFPADLQAQTLSVRVCPVRPCYQSCSPFSITVRFTVLSVVKGLWGLVAQRGSFHDEISWMSKRMYLEQGSRNSYTCRSLQVLVHDWNVCCDELQYCLMKSTIKDFLKLYTRYRQRVLWVLFEVLPQTLLLDLWPPCMPAFICPSDSIFPWSVSFTVFSSHCI